MSGLVPKAPFEYLLVTHVPFGISGEGPGRYLTGDMWREDLREQAHAIGQVGGRLTVAAPLFHDLKIKDSGSFNLVPIEPAREGFLYHPLTPYLSFLQFGWRLPRLILEIRRAVRKSAIVQADYGGHPVALGQLVWPIAGRHGAKRIWIFDGADPFPRLELAVKQVRNPLKRRGMGAVLKRFKTFCRRVFAEADLVFVHNDAVAQRFAAVWNTRCHLLPRTFVKDEMLVGQDELERRQVRVTDRSRCMRLVVAGRQIAIKGTDHVLRAMGAARARGADFRLAVLGEGDDLESFRSLAGELGLSDCVEFCGQVPYGAELFSRWSEADVMVITNLTPEISRNVFLGMARGLPLIMYRNPGTDRLVEEAQAALLIPCGDVEALAGGLCRVHQDRDFLVGIAARGLELARRHTLQRTHRTRAELAAAVLAGGLSND